MKAFVLRCSDRIEWNRISQALCSCGVSEKVKDTLLISQSMNRIVALFSTESQVIR